MIDSFKYFNSLILQDYLFLQECWSENTSDRPTFDQIFNKLANKRGVEEEEIFFARRCRYIEDVNEITDNTEKLLSQSSLLTINN